MYLNPIRNINYIYYEIHGEDHKIFTFVEPSSVCSELTCFLSAAISFWFFSISSESWASFSTKFHDIPYVKIEAHTVTYHITFNTHYLIIFPLCQPKVFGPSRSPLKRSIRDQIPLAREKIIFFVLVKTVIRHLVGTAPAPSVGC